MVFRIRYYDGEYEWTHNKPARRYVRKLKFFKIVPKSVNGHLPIKPRQASYIAKQRLEAFVELTRAENSYSMSFPMFKGLYVAIATPFNTNFSIDFEAYEKLVQHQVNGGVDGIVVAGTTGESPTFTDEEFTCLLEATKKYTEGKCQLIAGTGTNNTEHVLERNRLAAAVGVDGLLIVAPYYNKPTQAGLIEHYTYIADNTDLPIILYNVPGRTSVNILPDTTAVLAKHKQIVAIKEASNDMGQIMDVISKVPKTFAVLSGDDALSLSLCSVGGHGLVSVGANLAPALMRQYIDACLSGRLDSARKLHYRLLPLFKATFWESNPIPVKAGLSLLGFGKNVLRRPLVPMNSDKVKSLEEIFRQLDLM